MLEYQCSIITLIHSGSLIKLLSLVLVQQYNNPKILCKAKKRSVEKSQLCVCETPLFCTDCSIKPSLSDRWGPQPISCS